MAIKALVQNSFEGGTSQDSQVGPKNSFAFSQALDHRKAPGQLSVLPGLTKESASVVTDLVVNAVMDINGVVWAYGDTGKVYKRTTSGVWSVVGTTSTVAMGMSYRPDMDAIFLSGTKTVHRLYPISAGSPTLTSSQYTESYSTYDNSTAYGSNVSAYNASGASSITISSAAITENAANSRYFQLDIEPMTKISLWVTAAGTGTWTITLHDGENNVLGTATALASSLTLAQFNDFTFSSPIRIYPSPNARTYHIHAQVSGSSGTIRGTATTLDAANLRVYADRLISTRNGMHPIQRFQQWECIGNANYLTVWEPITAVPTDAEWLRHKLVFPQEYEVCGLTVQNEFLVIACERKATGDSNPQEGILFFWDGLSAKPNYFMPVPEGAPYSISTYRNVIYYQVNGQWYGVASPTMLPVKIHTLPGTDTEFTGTLPVTTGYPDMMTVRKGVLLMGFPSATTATAIKAGVYSWGSVNKDFNSTFGYSYVISTGTKAYSGSNNLQIGMVKNFGEVLLVSWRDTGVYGVDSITSSSLPASTAIYRGLVFDNGFTAKQKTALYMEIVFSLPANASLQMAYAIDGNIDTETFTNDDNSYTSAALFQAQSGYAKFNIPNGRFRYFQPQITITCSSATTAPKILMVALVFDDNSREVLQ